MNMRREQGLLAQTAALLASAFVVACGADPDDSTGHLVQTDPGPVRACAPGLEDGILGPSRIVCAVEDCDRPDVTVRVADLGAAVIEYEQGPVEVAIHGVYNPETATIWIDDEWFSDDTDWERLLIAHELGHARGLPHVCELYSESNQCEPGDEHNIMFPATAMELPVCGPCGCVD